MKVKLASSNAVCTDCLKTNFKMESSDNKIEDIYQLSIGSSQIYLCAECLQLLKRIEIPNKA